jgi:hypothetical protein
VSESSSASTGIAAKSSEARTSSRSRIFGWLTAGSSDERTRDLASTSLMESVHLAGTEPSEHKQVTSESSKPGFFSRFFGDRGSRSVNEPSAAIRSPQSSGSQRDLASSSLMESDHLAGTEPSEDLPRS